MPHSRKENLHRHCGAGVTEPPQKRREQKRRNWSSATGKRERWGDNEKLNYRSCLLLGAGGGGEKQWAGGEYTDHKGRKSGTFGTRSSVSKIKRILEKNSKPGQTGTESNGLAKRGKGKLRSVPSSRREGGGGERSWDFLESSNKRRRREGRGLTGDVYDRRKEKKGEKRRKKEGTTWAARQGQVAV